MSTWTTKQVAEIVGVSPRLVQLYRELGFYKTMYDNAPGTGKIVYHDIHDVLNVAIIVKSVRHGVTRRELRRINTSKIADDLYREMLAANFKTHSCHAIITRDKNRVFIQATTKHPCVDTSLDSVIILNLTQVIKEVLP